MSKRSGQIGFLWVAGLLLAGTLHAQTVDSSSASSDSGSSTSESTEPPPASTSTAQAVYVPALNGSGLIALDHSIRTRFLYGTNTSGGVDSNPAALAKGPTSGAFVLSPFGGVEADTGKVQYVLQYQPTFRQYTNDRYQDGSLHTASVKVGGLVDERWRWDIRALGSHGQDSIRFLAPQQNIAVGDIPGTGPGSASYRPDAGTITYVDGEASMKYNATQRDVIALNFGNQFSHYSTISGDSIIGTATVSYTRAVTQKFQWINYAQTARYYGVIHCSTFGGGVGMEWKPEPHSYLRLSGGPQVSSASCGKQQGFAYSVDYSKRLTSKSQVYFTSARQTASTYLGPGLWQKTVSIGAQHDFDKNQGVGFDFGYVSTSTLQGVMGYSGTYVDAGYNHRFTHSLSAALNYRRYAGDWSNASFTRNTALVSLSWTPSSGHIFQ